MNKGLEDGFLYWGVMAIVKSNVAFARMSVDGLRWSVRKKLVNRRWGCCQSKDPRGNKCARAWKKICAKDDKDDWLGMRRFQGTIGYHRHFNIVEMPMDSPDAEVKIASSTKGLRKITANCDLPEGISSSSTGFVYP